MTFTWRYPLLVSIGFCVAAGNALAGEPRAPNQFELAYTAMAIELDAHDLCAKISPSARTRAFFNSPGTQIYSERSRCFMSVAVSTLNPYFCRQVVGMTAMLLDGSYFTGQKCAELVAAGNPVFSNLTFDHGVVLQAMGYDDAAVTARFPNHPKEPAWLEYYYDIRKRAGGDFQRRLAELPDFSTE